MSGMQAFALCERIAAAYCASLAAGGCPSSQIAIVAPAAVPLWKVIVGPRADKLQPDPQGSGFSLGLALRDGGLLAPAYAGGDLRPPRPPPFSCFEKIHRGVPFAAPPPTP